MIRLTILKAWNTIRQGMMRFPRIAAEYAFPFTLLLIAAVGALSLALFYAYGFSVQTKRIEQLASLYDVKEELFLDTLVELKDRERNLESVGGEIFRDIFNPTELTEE